MKAEIIELENDLCEFYTKNKAGKGYGYGRRKIEEIVNVQNKELIEAYDEYIEFLSKELSRYEAFTVVRPYMAASGKVVAKGVELRAKIENLKTNKK